MKIGICGGTFDPFHRGHLEPIVAARPGLQWDRILYVPAYRQPFKSEREFASGHHRFAMSVLATEGHGEMFVTPLELERGAISYTVDTLRELRKTCGGETTLDWIIGDDNLARLHEWREIDAIFDLANFVVLTRSTAPVTPPAFASRVRSAQERGECGAIVFAQNRAVAVSSTEIRKRVRDGAPIDELVDPRVSRYIHHYGLYKEGHS